MCGGDFFLEYSSGSVSSLTSASAFFAKSKAVLSLLEKIGSPFIISNMYVQLDKSTTLTFKCIIHPGDSTVKYHVQIWSQQIMFIRNVSS